MNPMLRDALVMLLAMGRQPLAQRVLEFVPRAMDIDRLRTQIGCSINDAGAALQVTLGDEIDAELLLTKNTSLRFHIDAIAHR